MTENLHPYNEAARRLKAALISYQLGRSGVDRTLKEVPEDAGDDWAELAESLLRGMLEGVSLFQVQPPGPIQLFLAAK